jgi:hypothetical protein
MKKFNALVLSMLLLTNLYGQRNKEEEAIVNEGKKLYRSEMASWYGTDLFMEKYPEKRSDIGGYFSYSEGELDKCIFFSNAETPRVLATISFDSTYDMETANVDDKDRGFTPAENDIFTIRQAALDQINKDTLFKTYKNTNLNLIPLVEGNSRKVFVLTGPQKTNVVIFGNDYLLTFDKNNKLVSQKQLHKNILPVEYGETKSVAAMHSHLPTTGDLITSTDICTLMLYEKFANWDQYYVMGPATVSIWNCRTNTLATMSKEAFLKIGKDEKK